jgi:HEPN domain-containing protein
MNASRIEAQRWFRQARADLEVVRTLLAEGHYAAACFHAQQVAEKALKAALFSRGSRVVWGHSVRELARQCEAHDPAFAAVAEKAALLDQFYIPTRYPNGLPPPAIPSETYTVTQAEDAQEAAKRILYAVEAFLGD